MLRKKHYVLECTFDEEGQNETQGPFTYPENSMKGIKREIRFWQTRSGVTNLKYIVYRREVVDTNIVRNKVNA